MDQLSVTGAIEAEATKLIRRHQNYANSLHENLTRKASRSGIRQTKSIQTPAYWDWNEGFNPYHVRRNFRKIAAAVWAALSRRTFSPRASALFDLPKEGGGTREVSVFQIADQAVARLLYKRLLDKNKGRLSSRCFAYREDLTVHDAVLHLASNFAGRKRIFVAEYDFKKYFDSISHDHIEKVLQDRRFYISPEEHRILWAFTRTAGYRSGYSPLQINPRHSGIPQGVSTSLFLANVAAYPLDRALEGLRVDFARYADDTLIWSESYEEVCKAVDCLIDASRRMGVEFNFKKSDGVSVIVDQGAKAELKSATHVDFVGYQVSFEAIGIRKSTVSKIKKHISFLVYSNLLQQPLQGRFNMHSLHGFDRDYFVMIAQIRRYLYGNVTETLLQRFASGDLPEMQYRGLMSFYPIVDDREQLASLDGWLAHTIYHALRKRTRLFASRSIMLPAPHYVAQNDLIHNVSAIIRIPSFVRIAAHLRNAASVVGPNVVSNPSRPSS